MVLYGLHTLIVLIEGSTFHTTFVSGVPGAGKSFDTMDNVVRPMLNQIFAFNCRVVALSMEMVLPLRASY